MHRACTDARRRRVACALWRAMRRLDLPAHCLDAAVDDLDAAIAHVIPVLATMLVVKAFDEGVERARHDLVHGDDHFEILALVARLDEAAKAAVRRCDALAREPAVCFALE